MHFKNILLLTLVFILAGCNFGGDGALTLSSVEDQTTNKATAKTVTLSTTFGSGPLSYSAISDDADVVISVSGSTLTLTPSASWDGSATIIAKASFNGVNSNLQSFTLTVNPLSSFELLDPTFAAGNAFGHNMTVLTNGNIVVASPYDSSGPGGVNSGAVHLYNPYEQTVIKSFYGDQKDDRLGSSGVTALGNNNFVIASPGDNDSVGGKANAGSVMLVNGATGLQIGVTLVGDQKDDWLGSSGVTALGNNHFVIASPFDNVDGIEDAGSVMLVSGATGALIKTLVGDQEDDYLGNNGVTALANNNFVVISSEDQVDSIPGAGSVMLVSGATGLQIGDNILQGTTKEDMIFPRIITTTAPDAFSIGFPYFDKSEQVDSGFAKVFAY